MSDRPTCPYCQSSIEMPDIGTRRHFMCGSYVFTVESLKLDGYQSDLCQLRQENNELRKVEDDLAACFSDILTTDWFNEPDFPNQRVVITVNSHQTKAALAAHRALS